MIGILGASTSGRWKTRSVVQAATKEVRKLGLLALAPVVILAGCATYRERDATLRFDGVYQSERIENYWHYLRFYPDDNVITVSSTAQPNDLQPWFTREHTGVSKGKIRLKGKSISFSGESKAGVIDYEGELVGDQLRLHSHSHINGHQNTHSYVFVRWDAAQGVPTDAK